MAEHSGVYQAALENAPFVVFSKTAPATLPDYDVDRDFTYFYFNHRMNEISGLQRANLANSVRNAKMDFPLDFDQYFRDDAEVVMQFAFPAFKEIVEPWQCPGMNTVNHTHKTGVEIGDEHFMLGCFTPFDDVHMGVTTMRHRPLPPPLDPLPHVPLDWFEQAFMQLPLPVALFHAADLSMHSQNKTAETSNIITSLEQIRDSVPAADETDPKRSICELSLRSDRAGGSDEQEHPQQQQHHVFIWRLPEHPLLAVAVWGPLEPLPQIVVQRLRLSK